MATVEEVQQQKEKQRESSLGSVLCASASLAPRLKRVRTTVNAVLPHRLKREDVF